MNDQQAVAISIAKRTPVARAGKKGVLKDVRSDDLAAGLLRSVLGAIAPHQADVSDLLLGCVNQSNEQNRNVAKVVGLLGGLPASVPAQTINRGCASSLDALIHGARAIALGDADLTIVGGLESMSRQPQGSNSASNPTLLEEFGSDVMSMGITAENVAQKLQISRSEQDEWSLLSHQRAIRALQSGHFRRETQPVEIGDISLTEDNGPRPTTSLEALADLPPVFLEGGTVTAGNSSQISDGASMCVLSSHAYAEAHDLPARACLRASAAVGYEPSLMGLGPLDAISALLRKTKMSTSDVDLFELNEAFASQTIGVIRLANLDPEKVNVNGGAIALGHAVGNSGTRLVVSMLHELERRDLERGVVTLCVGLGQGVAVMVERSS